MGDIVNLRRARKAKARTEAAGQAQVNRALHGRTAAQKARDTAARERQDRTLDGARIESGD
jgi:hypothetical protein